MLAHRLDGRRGSRVVRLLLSRPAALAALCAGALVWGKGCGSSKNATTPAPVDAGANPTGASDSGGADSASAASDAAAEAAALPSKQWDWTGIIGTGQSLSVGAQGNPILDTTQPYNNLKLDLGDGGTVFPPFDPTSSVLSMVPLVEPIHWYATTYPSAYPANINGETPHTAMADEITSLYHTATNSDYITVHSVVGESGQPMSVIDKTAVEVDDAGTSMGRAYAATLFEVSAISRLATAAKKTYGVGAIVITHGEADSGNTAYESDLVKLWSDYNADLSQITGQTTSIPMLVSQQHSVPSNAGSGGDSTLAEWKVGVDNPGNIICSGPKYQYGYFSDGIHLLTPGYRQLGEKYAEVYYYRVVLGQNWQPLQPTSIDRSGMVLTVHFHVPVEPMVWDDKLPMPHQTMSQWANGRGFEVGTLSSPVTITSVAIVGDTVQITCAQDLTGLYLNVGYAYTTDGVMMPNGTFRWGQLRDSDAFVGSVTGTPQPNYAVSFSMVPP